MIFRVQEVPASWCLCTSMVHLWMSPSNSSYPGKGNMLLAGFLPLLHGREARRQMWRVVRSLLRNGACSDRHSVDTTQ